MGVVEMGAPPFPFLPALVLLSLALSCVGAVRKLLWKLLLQSGVFNSDPANTGVDNSLLGGLF